MNSLTETTTFDVDNLERRINYLEPLLKQFDEVQSAMEEEEGLQGITDEEARTQFENQYYNLITAASKLIGSSRKDADLSSQIRLPVVELPKFNGAYEQWFPFYDVFVSLIDANKICRGYKNFTISSHPWREKLKY